MATKMSQELEKKLWASADSLRGNISSEQYMHIVIGIMFLKHMSDKYEKTVKKIKIKHPDSWIQLSKIKDVIKTYGSSFIIPKEASWSHISNYASDVKIGEKIDRAFELIENENQELKGLFDKNYNREELDQRKLGEVVSEFSNIDLVKMGEDIIGRTYEYFLGEFFKKQGQKGGEFYTPQSIVKLMVDIVGPDKGKIYDPTAGTGGMLVQARERVISKGGNPDALVAYGQEYQNKTWKLSKINLLLHGFASDQINMGHKSADSFTEDLHKGERFDYILANPPFNVKKWGFEKLQEDPRWEWGLPPKGNANYAFISHMIHKLKNKGIGATVLANGSLSASGKSETSIRKKWIKDNVIEAIIALPDKLFYTVGIPACIWVFKKNKNNKKILMIDASELEGNMISKKVRELTEENMDKIYNIFKHFRDGKEVTDIGFAKSVSEFDIKNNDYSFVPGRYVGFSKEVIDKEKKKKEIKEASKELYSLFKEFKELIPIVEKSIEKALKLEDKD